MGGNPAHPIVLLAEVEDQKESKTGNLLLTPLVCIILMSSSIDGNLQHVEEALGPLQVELPLFKLAQYANAFV